MEDNGVVEGLIVLCAGVSLSQKTHDKSSLPVLEPIVSNGTSISQKTGVQYVTVENVVSRGTGLRADYDTAYEPHIIYHKSVTDKDTEV